MAIDVPLAAIKVKARLRGAGGPIFGFGCFGRMFAFRLFMEQRLARSRCFESFLFLSTFFIQVLLLSYKLQNGLSITIMVSFTETCV